MISPTGIDEQLMHLKRAFELDNEAAALMRELQGIYEDYARQQKGRIGS